MQEREVRWGVLTRLLSEVQGERAARVLMGFSDPIGKELPYSACSSKGLLLVEEALPHPQALVSRAGQHGPSVGQFQPTHHHSFIFTFILSLSLQVVERGLLQSKSQATFILLLTCLNVLFARFQNTLTMSVSVWRKKETG